MVSCIESHPFVNVASSGMISMFVFVIVDNRYGNAC